MDLTSFYKEFESLDWTSFTVFYRLRVCHGNVNGFDLLIMDSTSLYNGFDLLDSTSLIRPPWFDLLVYYDSFKVKSLDLTSFKWIGPPDSTSYKNCSKIGFNLLTMDLTSNGGQIGPPFDTNVVSLGRLRSWTFVINFLNLTCWRLSNSHVLGIF